MFDRTLLANQALTDLSLTIDGDSDFVLMAVKGSSTGAYNIRVRLPNARYMQSAQVQNANFVGTAQFPVPIVPAVVIGAAGRLGIDITDTSGVQNIIQLVFVGVRRYQVR